MFPLVESEVAEQPKTTPMHTNLWSCWWNNLSRHFQSSTYRYST